MLDNLIIVAVFALLAAPLATTLYKAFMKWFKNDTDKDVSEYGEREFREGLIKALGAEILSTRESSYYVNYHGGGFMLHFAEDNRFISIVYPELAAFDNEAIAKALKVANMINSESFWSVYIGYHQDEEQPLRADCSLCYFPMGSFNECVRTLKAWLDHPFAISREFNEMMDSKEYEEDLPITKLEQDAIHKINYEQYHRERTMAQDRGVEDSDGRLTIANLLALSPDVDFGCIEGLRIVVNDDIERYNDADEILAFDIKKFVMEHPQHSRITLLADFEKESLMVDVKKTDGGDEKHLLYRMTVSRAGGAMNDEQSYKPHSFTTSLAINLTTDEEDAWEAKYMLEEMEFPHSLDCLDYVSKIDYYWGFKLFKAGNYLQALPHLKRVYYHLRTPDEDNCIEAYNFICYMLGVVYMRLNMPDTAYLYLTIVVNRTGNTNCLYELARCLSNINKADALDMLLEIIAVVKENIDKAREKGETETYTYKQMQITYLYINRVIANETVKRRMYDKAEKLLEGMIESDCDADFAREMLAMIEKDRNC